MHYNGDATGPTAQQGLVASYTTNFIPILINAAGHPNQEVNSLTISPSVVNLASNNASIVAITSSTVTATGANPATVATVNDSFESINLISQSIWDSGQ